MKTLTLCLILSMTALASHQAQTAKTEQPKKDAAPAPTVSEIDALRMQNLQLKYEILFKEFQNSEPVRKLQEESAQLLKDIQQKAGNPSNYQLDTRSMTFVKTETPGNQ